MWNKALDKNLDTKTIALDIAGAFNSVWHKGLLAKLKSFGNKGALLKLLKSYQTD